MDTGYMLRDAKTGRILSVSTAVARKWRHRLLGLLGRKTLGSDEALLLLNTNSIHTWFMRFSIDVVFLDECLAVIRAESGLAPFRSAACPGAAHTLEIPAGRWARWGVPEGTLLVMEKAGRAVSPVPSGVAE